MDSLILEYQRRLGDPHSKLSNPFSLNFLDYWLREAIGKTKNIKVAKASHNIIKSKEAGEGFCRVCNKDLRVVTPRINDYLVLRHPHCVAPICFGCSVNRPDTFYKAFDEGLKKYQEFRSNPS